MADTIGFIGLGLMGKPMATNLLKRGYRVIVHSRSADPVDDLVAAGGARADSPAGVARQVTRLITMLPDSPDVERVLEGPDGVFSALQPGTILIDCSSISPAVARRLAAGAHARGASMLDAPVSGGEIGAIGATLSIMVGGDAAAFAAVKPILDAMGSPERVVRIGEAGAGQICKVCNQMVIGGTLAAVSEAFTLARKAGVDAAKVREALLGGFAASRVLGCTANASSMAITSPDSARVSTRRTTASPARRSPHTGRRRRCPRSSSSSSPPSSPPDVATKTTRRSRRCSSKWPG
jgi:2-hydroxy-3-oxopropionate reductase